MAEMRNYVIRRLIQFIPLIFVIIIFNFFLIHLAPGDPALIMAGERGDPEYVQSVRERYGLDKPVQVQLMIYLGNVLKGDLGYSLMYNMPVTDVIFSTIPATLLLIIPTQLFSFIIGTLLGAYSARHFPSRRDSSISLTSVTLYSIPIFWLGLVFIMFLSVKLGWFPTSGMRSFYVGEDWLDQIIDLLRHLFLPFMTLTLSLGIPQYIRVTRASIIEIMREDFIVTARAAGLKESAIYYKHALRNALLPAVTMAGLHLGFALSGALLTETVFAWPGMGRLMYTAVSFRDYPLLMGNFFFVAIFVLVAGLITDIVYAYLDPRVLYK